MKLETIVQDYPINFGDCVPSYKDIMLEATDQICIHEGDAIDLGDANEYFQIMEGRSDDFGGAFINTPKGSYILHDLREETFAEGVVTYLYFSITKIINP